MLLACKRPRPLLAEVLKTIETIGTIFFLLASRHRKEKRIVPIVSETSASKEKIVSIVSIVFKKKQEGEKPTLLFCFVFSVSCFLQLSFSQIGFIPNCLYPIGFIPNCLFPDCLFPQLAFSIVFFPNCLYSAPVNCPIKKMAPVARSFMM